LKDEIAQEIASELRLIREELQNLTMAVRSASRRNFENSYTGKSHKSYPRRTGNPTDVRHSKGISYSEVLNAASHEANGIKMLQRIRDNSQRQFVAFTNRVYQRLIGIGAAVAR
jgi:hypothetical protein